MANSNLKYLIAGTGGVGGSIAAFLSLSGKDVTCIARGEHLAAIRGNGLQLHSDLKGEHSEIATEYCVKGIPCTFILDEENRIVAKNLRGKDLEKKISEMLKKKK